MTDAETGEELLNALTAIDRIDIVIYGDITIGNAVRNDIHAGLADNRTAIRRIAERVGNRVEGRGGEIVTLDTGIRIGERVAIAGGRSDETIDSLDIIIGKTVFTI